MTPTRVRAASRRDVSAPRNVIINCCTHRQFVRYSYADTYFDLRFVCNTKNNENVQDGRLYRVTLTSRLRNSTFSAVCLFLWMMDCYTD